MKKLIILTFLFSCIGYSQTKQETIDWLNLKLRENTSGFMGQYSIKIQNETDWGETLVVTVHVNNAYMNERYDYYSFLPKNISSVSTTKKFRTDGKLGLIIAAKSDNIYYNGREFVDKIDILCTEAPDETIIRIQKGIIHLLNLMGNPLKAPKELFTN